MTIPDFRFEWDSDNPTYPPGCALAGCRITEADICVVHAGACPPCGCGSSLHWWPTSGEA